MSAPCNPFPGVCQGEYQQDHNQKASDRKSIEITDAKLLRNFRVWAGSGTSPDDAKSLIVDWSRGRVAEAPKGLQRYEVDFYARFPDERLIYLVFYQYDPVNRSDTYRSPAKLMKGTGLTWVPSSMAMRSQGRWLQR
jgi:hypothetical protein